MTPVFLAITAFSLLQDVDNAAGRRIPLHLVRWERMMEAASLEEIEREKKLIQLYRAAGDDPAFVARMEQSVQKSQEFVAWLHRIRNARPDPRPLTPEAVEELIIRVQRSTVEANKLLDAIEEKKARAKRGLEPLLTPAAPESPKEK